MDFSFNCPFCSQALTIDESGAGSEIECPSCSEMLIIPMPEQAQSAREERPLTLPSTGRAAAKIMKPSRPLDVAAKGDRKLRLKSFRRQDHVKDGRDNFDETVSDFFAKTGEGNVVSVHPFQYTCAGKEPGQSQVDYGVVIIYKG